MLPNGDKLPLMCCGAVFLLLVSGAGESALPPVPLKSSISDYFGPIEARRCPLSAFTSSCKLPAVRVSILFPKSGWNHRLELEIQRDVITPWRHIQRMKRHLVSPV